MIQEIKGERNDAIETTLRSYAQHVLTIVFGLLPLVFIPSAIAPFEYTKIGFVVLGIFAALILYSLSVLRSGTITFGKSYPLLAMWVVVLVALLSSFLSGDLMDSLVGDFFSIHGTVFVALLALIPTVWFLLRAEKTSVMRLYILLAVSTLVLVLFHVTRLFFGPDFLSFGLFANAASSPVGSWNDLALFFGLAILISLVTLEQLPLTRGGKILFGVVTVASLLMLGVINFFIVWVVLGFTSLAMVVYGLGKDRFTENQLPLMGGKATNMTSLVMALVVFAASVVFIVGGSALGGMLAKLTNVSYVEVRPSFEATADIARNVYSENAFLGIGTNKFTDAWRLYKDPNINLTPFWNTDFNAGNGYITTFFVTNGVLGGLAWIVFLVLYGVTGVRRLLGATNGDRMWFFIGVSSFVSAIYIWGMSIVYVPGVVILLLGSLCTGISLYAFTILSGNENYTFAMGMNRSTGFVLTLGVITVIVGSVSAIYLTGRHYSSVYAFNQSVQSLQQGKAIDQLEQEVMGAWQLYESDVFARRIAEYQFSRMNGLAGVKEPTEADKEQFQKASTLGLTAAQRAVALDGQEPSNWAILGSIYSVLASVQVEGAQEKAVEALSKAKELNPKNPLPYVELGIVAARAGDAEGARALFEQAITLKQNYTDAFFLLSQLEIATGNIDGAIRSTQAIVRLEPQNAARHYQLGVLFSAKGDIDSAILAFEQAIDNDQNYANARYLLGMAYDQKGRSEEAKAQFQKVLELNPGNQEVSTLIDTITREGSLKSLRQGGVTQTVNEAMPTTEENGTVHTATPDSDSALVKPVNTIPKTEADASAATPATAGEQQ